MPSTWLIRLPRESPKTTMNSSEETTGASVVWVQRRRTRWHSRRESQRKLCQGRGRARSSMPNKVVGSSVEVKLVTRSRVRSAISTLFLVVGLLALFAQPAAASPGPYKVLFVNAIGPGDCIGDNGVQNQMATLPGVVKVDAFDAIAGTPTVAQLAAYDEVVFHADCGDVNDPGTLGNNLPAYVDHGGVVFQYAFTMQMPGG